MARYNVNFELSVEDVEIIEEALRRSKSELSKSLIEKPANNNEPCAETGEADQSVRRIHELLGRLHNQKIFYRPKSRTYIGG
jgi:hypothetical protein